MDDSYDFAHHDHLLAFGSLQSSSDPRSHSYPPFLQHHLHSNVSSNPSWPPLSLDAMDDTMPHQHHHHLHHSSQYLTPASGQQQSEAQIQQNSRPSSSHHGNPPMPLQTTGLDLTYANMLPPNWQYELPHQHQQQPHFTMPESNSINMTHYNPAFGAQLQASPVDFMPTTSADTFAVTGTVASSNFMTLPGPIDSMNALAYPLQDFQNDMIFPMHLTAAALNQQTAESVHSHSSLPGSSPTGTAIEVNSVSDNEGTGAWSIVQYSNRHSFESTISNPSQNLHIRTSSDCSSSDDPSSAELSGSYEEIPNWPLSSPHDFHGHDYLDSHYVQHQTHGLPVANNPVAASSAALVISPAAGGAASYGSSSSSSTSPTSSGPTSPPMRRRKSPLEGKTTKAVIKKTPSGSRKDSAADKKVGRRRGPLRPEQRQQAHEIRKLRACLRCKFLKKTCDKGEPCGGCRPSHARLWQVPCTRMDIKDIGYFMKDWKVDYERHVSLGFSVGNIKGFSTLERTLYITHGYGHYLPINAREVFVRDDKCFGMDWIETEHSENPEQLEVNTAKLSAGIEGVSMTLLSEYLDRHLDNGFEKFVDELFEGTKFLTEMLKTAYRYYLKEKTPSIRKALKLVLAYNLTTHITMVEGLSEEEDFAGKIEDDRSKYRNKTIAPVMINFQVKCALADMWRELQKDILEELSTLYSSVYSGDKLKNWPTIFMLAAILLAIWEEMQFDSHYRTPNEAAVNKFCDDMESTPVGVIVGLFQAISTKLPGLQEWDTRKHHHLLGSNPAVCDALTEVKGHVNKYEKYLKERSTGTKFDREDFDCLSNKFLSKLVIRAN